VVLVVLVIFAAVTALRFCTKNSKKQYKKAASVDDDASDFEMSDVEAAQALKM